MRLALACLTSPKADVHGNLDRHRRVLHEATSAGCDLAVFPEMSLTGYLTPAAGWDAAVTLDDARVAELVAATAGGAGAAFGIVEVETGAAGATRFVTQIVAMGGRVVLVQRKRRLGADEGELFAAAPDGGSGAVTTVAGRGVAVAICAEVHHGETFAAAAAAGADVLLCCAAPGLTGRRADAAGWRNGYEWWRGAATADVSRFARAHGLWCAVATATGATADEDFPGWAALVAPDGHVVAETDDGREQTLVVDLPPPHPI